ncbi:MAG: cytochrome c3 family protein [Deltaproteobacteria bacterium]|nr:cytochrome c3 family protein [Deltaproteobacteria bacterium]
MGRSARSEGPRWLGWALLPLLGVGAGVMLYLGTLTPSQYRGLRFVTYDPEILDALIDPHAYEGKPVCQACHPIRDKALLDDPIAVCTRCHTFEHASHPVGVIQRRIMEPPRPLGEGNAVVCHSCHDPHRVRKGQSALRDEFDALCLSCHRRHERGR